MQKKAYADKIFCIGIDGMDPRLTRKYVDEGKMPNVKKLIERGACRQDLAMVGAMPTVTPPMWTTLATGAYPNTHGITCFYRATDRPDVIAYNFDSRHCKAEQLWNVFAEAGKRTLVWHWPGSAWPPSSDSENLWVVDGTSPGSVAMSAAVVEQEFMLSANVNNGTATFLEKAAAPGVQPCVVNDLDLDQFEQSNSLTMAESTSASELSCFVLDPKDGQGGSPDNMMDLQVTYLREPENWPGAPEGAKEFVLLLGRGMIRRPALFLKNEDGIYDTVAVYKSKKDEEPMYTIKKGEMKVEVVDAAMKGDKKYDLCNRNIKLLQAAEDGSNLKMWVSSAMDMTMDGVYKPKSLFKTITENIGYPTPTTMNSLQDPELIQDVMLANWYTSADWQAACLNYLIENEGVEVIFSHFHAIDLQSHMIVRYMTDRDYLKLPVSDFQKFMEDVYIQADYYVGKFMHLLDEGWALTLMSDHAQVCPKHDFPLIGDIVGVNVRVMQELGLTALKKDENGNDMKEIDWKNTYAVASRANHIYLNLKGRYEHGIIDPEDQYEWEEEIMTRLYNYKDKKTGKRIIALAVRNKDAVLFGLGGPECGDIIYFNAEGYNYDHGESLGTCYGESDTSVCPIFIMAGPGIKQGFYTDRVIREVDFAPTVAVLGGVRMPAQCEGAPVYQIFEDAI